MLRKIIFIFFTVLSSMQNKQKTVILLLLQSISLVYTIYSKPFALTSLNNLDVSSNFTFLMTIFAGSLYVLELGEETKIFLFFFIIIFNLKFMLKWLLTVFDILVFVYEKNFFRICPWFLNFYAIMKKSFHETKFSYNLMKYLPNLLKNMCDNMKTYRLDLIK